MYNLRGHGKTPLRHDRQLERTKGVMAMKAMPSETLFIHSKADEHSSVYLFFYTFIEIIWLSRH